VRTWVCCCFPPTDPLPEDNQPEKCRIEGNAINIENDPKFEATDTEFEATEKVKEGEHWEGGWQLAPDEGSEEIGGDDSSREERGGDEEAPGGVNVIFHPQVSPQRG